MNKPYKYPAITLAHSTLAQLTLPNEYGVKHNYRQNELLIVVASTMDEPGGYCPAESVRVIGQEGIERLRDFLNEHYPVKEEIK